MMQSIDPPAGTAYAKSVKITDRFIGDHKTFRKMLFELGQMAWESPDSPHSERLRRLVELFRGKLAVHLWEEEQIFPLLEKQLDAEVLEKLDSTLEQHRRKASVSHEHAQV